MLPLSNLKELTKGGNTDSVTFETGDGLNLSITNPVGGHDLCRRVTGIDPAEFPPLPEAPETRPAEGFIETYQRLVPFASTDTTRPVLNSVYIDTSGQGERPVTMVATDGRRLSMRNSLVLPVSESIIVPITKYLCWPSLESSTALGLRTGLVKDKPRVLGLCVRGHHWCYDVKLIEGTYPNYRQLYQQDLPMRFDVAVKNKAPVIERHVTHRTTDQFHRMVELVKRVESMVAAEHWLPNEQSFYCAGCSHQAACKAWHREQARVSVRLAA